MDGDGTMLSWVEPLDEQDDPRAARRMFRFAFLMAVFYVGLFLSCYCD
jgi:hypothetical protein